MLCVRASVCENSGRSSICEQPSDQALDSELCETKKEKKISVSALCVYNVAMLTGVYGEGLEICLLLSV